MSKHYLAQRKFYVYGLLIKINAKIVNAEAVIAAVIFAVFAISEYQSIVPGGQIYSLPSPVRPSSCLGFRICAHISGIYPANAVASVLDIVNTKIIACV
ncbi:hypothetical protein J6253_07035, partial [bacterium]|nr:hypothetical protein [bacterium]